MHLCFVTYGSWEGNAGLNRPRHLGGALLDRGVRVTYLVDDLPANEDLNLDPRADVALVRAPRGPQQVLTRRHTLRRVCPDVVHLLNPHAKSLALIAGNRRLRVLAEWDEPPIMRPFGPARHALEVYLDGWLRRRADHQVAVTRWLQEHFRERYGLELPYIPHGTYLGPFPPSESPYDEPTAVYLGTFVPQWDHDVVFEAAALLASRRLRPRIDFIGTGQDLGRWRAFAAERGLDNLRFVGWRSEDELQRRLRHAHVQLFPIRDTELNRARCPSKTFAYAQARRPVITCRVGEVPEVLGSAATYVAATPVAFADALEGAMTGDAPDVDYGVERHSYADRAERLLAALEGPRQRRSRSARNRRPPFRRRLPDRLHDT